MPSLTGRRLASRLQTATKVTISRTCLGSMRTRVLVMNHLFSSAQHAMHGATGADQQGWCLTLLAERHRQCGQVQQWSAPSRAPRLCGSCLVCRREKFPSASLTAESESRNPNCSLSGILLSQPTRSRCPDPRNRPGPGTDREKRRTQGRTDFRPQCRNRGTKFTLHLPAAPAVEELPHKAEIPAEVPQPRRILVVEGEEALDMALGTACTAKAIKSSLHMTE
jgi:hypothetical protein